MDKLTPKSTQPPEGRNFMYALMEAVSKDQSTMSEQQVTDAESTEKAVNLETDIYFAWKLVLNKDARGVVDAAKKGGKNEASNVQAAQAEFSKNNAIAQQNESQQDGQVQSAQGQAQSDASNLAQKVQMMQSANSILTTLVNMLGQITG